MREAAADRSAKANVSGWRRCGGKVVRRRAERSRGERTTSQRSDEVGARTLEARQKCLSLAEGTVHQ